MSFLRSSTLRCLAVACLAGLVLAHEHHDEDIPDGEGITAEPLDSILWIHILVQSFAWGILFPTGMVLGLIRSRWHVPVQALAAVIAILGYFLGHWHKGRQFATNAHSKFANLLMLIMFTQLFFGAYLKLHLEKYFQAKIRKVALVGHAILGALLPILAWVQMLLGGIAALGFCRGDHLGQCLAHFIMGSAFIAYGICLVILLLVGQAWLRRTNRSQEFFDSAVIAVWGCFNTFTEHRWGTAWVHNDFQHTSMGIIWWCAGLLGMWLSRTRDGRPKRNVFPSIVIFMTGWAMSAHPQTLMVSAMTHSVFGKSLMAAGLTRMIEICFILKDKDTVSLDGNSPKSFQHLTPFLLIASGFLFMGATEEQMLLLNGAGIDAVSYTLVLYSTAFLLYLYVNLLLHLYAVNAMPATNKPDADTGRQANGHVGNGSIRLSDTRLRDADDFELHDLTESDAEGDEEEALVSKENGRVR